MPTASPIMTASTGVVELMSVAAAARRMPSMPVPTPREAATSGAPAARTEPKVTSRTTAAMTTPTSSVPEMPMPTFWPMLPPSWMSTAGSAAWA